MIVAEPDPLLQNVPPGGRPAEVDAARAVLGAALVDQRCVEDLAPRLAPDAFYVPAHQTIWRAILELHRQRKPVDVVLMREHLDALGVLEQVGGAAGLADLSESVPTAANASYYASTVERAYRLREVIRACGDLQSYAFTTRPLPEAAEVAKRAHAVADAAAGGHQETGVGIGALAARAFERAARREVPVVWSTGLRGLDERLGGGLRPGKLTLIAARPSMGKTALVTRVARHVAWAGVGVSLFSLEVDGDGLTLNMLAAETGVAAGRLATGAMAGAESDAFVESVDNFQRLPLTVHEGRRWRFAELVRAIHHDVRRNTPPTRVVVIDYVQLVEPDEEGRSRAEEIAQVSRELKLLALDLGIAVVAAAQLSREVEKRRDKWPMMSDLRESGALEQDADNILLLHRPEYYEPKEENRGMAHVDVAKNRDGPPGVVDLRFVAECMRFEDLPEPEPAWKRAARERGAAAGADAWPELRTKVST